MFICHFKRSHLTQSGDSSAGYKINKLKFSFKLEEVGCATYFSVCLASLALLSTLVLLMELHYSLSKNMKQVISEMKIVVKIQLTQYYSGKKNKTDHDKVQN